MSDTLKHRGPDGAGHFADDHALLAMRRLSIIDLESGWQPLYNEDRSLALVANGEVYNYIELREQLRAQGHSFRTGSDCEMILHLYEEYGADCVHHLRGMFAFALWDSRTRTLLLARDRLGEKPLYLAELPGMLLFASEMKGLLASGHVPFELDQAALDLYMSFQYIPEPRTAVKGTRKLPAGHLLLVEVDDWRVTETCYWRIQDSPPIAGDPISLIRDELKTVAALTIRSDAPVGVALSGGLDSSLIAALAAEHYPGSLQAICAGYPGQRSNDERAAARTFAAHLGIPFHEVEIATSDLIRDFPALCSWRDDPIADIAGYGYYMIMKRARELGIKVMLQGQGGDELFWGYTWVRDAARMAEHGAQLRWPDSVRPRALPRSFDQLKAWLIEGGGLRTSLQDYRFAKGQPPDQFRLYNALPQFRTRVGTLHANYRRGFLNGGLSRRAAVPAAPRGDVDDVRITQMIVESYLLENGIAQGDRLSMAASVELRLPLTDYRLAELVVGLRKHQSDRELPPKAWLRSAAAELLPEWVMSRPKRGFTPPIVAWRRALRGTYGDHLADGYLVAQGMFTSAQLRRLDSYPYATAEADIFFDALVLEEWCRQMDQVARAAGPGGHTSKVAITSSVGLQGPMPGNSVRTSA